MNQSHIVMAHSVIYVYPYLHGIYPPMHATHHYIVMAHSVILRARVGVRVRVRVRVRLLQ